MGSDQESGGAKRGWLARMGAPIRDTANTADREGVVRLSECIDLAALRAYRQAVGRRTRQIIQHLTAEDVRRPVAEPALWALLADDSVTADAMDLLYYWGSLNCAGLLLMPATRHPFVHWNEALRLKSKKTA